MDVLAYRIELFFFQITSNSFSMDGKVREDGKFL